MHIITNDEDKHGKETEDVALGAQRSSLYSSISVLPGTSLFLFFPCQEFHFDPHSSHLDSRSQRAHAVRERKNVHSTPCVITLDGGSGEKSTELDGIWRNVREANPHGASHNYMCILRAANHSSPPKR
jgi:hypothetical protein